MVLRALKATWGAAGTARRADTGGPQGPRPAQGALAARCRIAPGESRLRPRARRARTPASWSEPPALDPQALPVLPSPAARPGAHKPGGLGAQPGRRGRSGSSALTPTCLGTSLAC